MKINLMCDARGEGRTQFLDRLMEIAGDDIDLRLHMGHSDADWHAPAISQMKNRKGKRGYFMGNQKQTGANMALIASPEYGQMLETAVDQMHRKASAYRYRSHNLQNVQDYLDYYHILSDIFAQRMIEHEITHVLFFNMPHLAYDMIMYQVAKSLGLQTLILCQTIFPSQYFSMQRIEDYGRFDPATVDAPPHPIEKGSIQKLFYMDDRWQQGGETGRITVRGLYEFLSFLVLKQPSRLLQPRWIVQTLKRMSAIYGSLPAWRDPFAKFFHENELAYLEHLAEYDAGQVDFEQNYIYVPLHNQPEMSTSTLGGKFRDQVLLIEALAADLPEGWRIYVKENPRQGAYARGPMFFHRLSRIPAVTFVASYTDTATLSDHAQFVASVTGTAGWEAIRKGVPAMVFGAAWYGSLPGVYRYEPGLDFEAIAATEIDHEKLQKDAGGLLSRAHRGVIEKVYLNIAPDDFDPAQNRDDVARTIQRLLLGQQPLSFGGTLGVPEDQTAAG
ncbi:hypothetical protein [Thalassorhabdomicrobium marinisediminis]|uniref:capsular polysaccharide export protein, LipB/KpsS family n=1 Tax=Thalassorhabdomicrobium marinisediminis TaxID=2170577 RepID=UPI002491EA8E|nr:hypothetical protein [Thalassorhabdomicrobium marinisediminis]